MRVKSPFRWCGGKTQLLPQLLELAPKSFKVYHEPFLGGGALFFALQPKVSWLSDLNPHLINAYASLQNNVDHVVEGLRGLERSKERFLAVREAFNRDRAERWVYEQATRFVYLNRTCFNGLWRENSKGEFNVPYGGDKAAPVLDEPALRAASTALRGGAAIQCVGFEAVEEHAKEGDFAYFDPPYAPVSATSFTSYTADGFGADDQVRLRDLARRLKDRGVHVMLSNSDAPIVRELYDGFDVREAQARRSINSDGQGRGKVGELIIR